MGPLLNLMGNAGGFTGSSAGRGCPSSVAIDLGRSGTPTPIEQLR